MAISDKTRKLLWGRSGNRCAFCYCVLSVDNTTYDPHCVVGDECHIISRSSEGPRADRNYPKDRLNEYENLILLCKVHHKLVDDQPIEYSAMILRGLKQRHEHRIAGSLTSMGNKPKEKTQDYLLRIKFGRELFSIVCGAYASDFDHDELQDEREVALVSGFLQNAQDWGDLGDTMEAGARVAEGFNLTKSIQELEASGFLVFGSRIRRNLKMGDQALTDSPIAILRVLRKSNPLILSTAASSR